MVMAQVNSMQLVVSGMWGIFMYKEVRGTANIGLWFLFAFATLGLILLLQKEKE